MSNCNAAFRDTIVSHALDALQRIGFTRFRKSNVDWPLHDGFHAWVGLNTGLYPDCVNLEPFVGIHVVQIAKLYNGLDKGRYQTRYSRSVATYAVHMGELDAVKDVAVFEFTPEQSDGFIQSELERMADLYATVGLDFARSLASYEALLPLLRERVPMLGGYPQRVASCLYLMRRKAKARQFVEEFLPLHRNVFEGFAVPFLAKLEAEVV